MSRPSPTSRRHGRSRAGRTQFDPSQETLDLLRGDYPEAVKQRIYLASRGALRGARRCVMCQVTGTSTRVFVPEEALRPVDPVFDAIQAYWLCAKHRALDDQDPALRAALARRQR